MRILALGAQQKLLVRVLQDGRDRALRLARLGRQPAHPITIAEQVLQVTALGVRLRGRRRRVLVVIDETGRPLGQLAQERLERGVTLQAQHGWHHIDALAARDVTKGAPRLAPRPALVRDHAHIRAEPRDQRLQQPLEPGVRNDDGRTKPPLGLLIQVREAVQRHSGLAVPGLSQDQHGAARRARDGRPLGRVEVHVDQRASVLPEHGGAF